MDFNSAGDCLIDHWVRENCMREVHFDAAYLVEPLDLIRAEICIQSAQIIFQLRKFTCAQENDCAESQFRKAQTAFTKQVIFHGCLSSYSGSLRCEMYKLVNYHSSCQILSDKVDIYCH